MASTRGGSDYDGSKGGSRVTSNKSNKQTEDFHPGGKSLCPVCNQKST